MMKSKSPICWVPSAYFAEGLPFVALSLASVIMFADLGVDEASITFWTSLLILPYTIKPLWSPLLELYSTKKRFVLLMQLIVGCCFGAMAIYLGQSHWFAMTIGLMFVIAVSGATNDIATDGIYLTALDKTTQARYIGWQGAFYNLAKILVNGALVYLAGCLITGYVSEGVDNVEFMAWNRIIAIIAGMMILLALYHSLMLPTGSRNEEAPADFRSAMVSLYDVFKDFFTKRHIWLYILFIVCYRLTEGFAVKMIPLFLKASPEAGGLGMSNESIGLIYGTLGTGAFILGSILSGYYIAHFGLKKVLFTLVCIFNIPFVIYYFLAAFPHVQLWVIAAGLITEYLCYGFGFVGLTLFMMQQVAPGKHPMAHYAFASGIMNLGFMLPGMVSGWVFQHVGYENFFLIAVAMSVPSFLLALKIPFNNNTSDNN